MKVGAVLLSGAALTCFDLRGEIIDDIRVYIESGDFESAIAMARTALDGAPDGKDSGELWQVLGEAQYYAPGMRRESALAFGEAKERGVPSASLYLGRLAMLDYDFVNAQKLFGEYSTMQRKRRGQLDPDLAYDQADATEGARQFERMQDIVVIDAVKVPRKEFFKHLRIPLSAGRVISSSDLPLDDRSRDRGPAAFVSESGDLMMWSEANDSTGMLQLKEATRLTDGTLSDVREAPEFLSQEGDLINPFLSADGTTLYYCANGDNTVGGYDIFIATRDPQTGEYLQPVNAGIPFNSAADEYVMAIDEENGVGWWATDRHYLPDGMITLYVYILPEERMNLEASADEKRNRARLDDIRLTWTAPERPSAPDSEEDGEDEDEDDEADDDPDSESDGPTASGSAGMIRPADPEEAARRFRLLAAEIRKIQPGQKPRRHDCTIPLGKGKFIYSADDVRSDEEKKLVQEYISAKKTYDSDCSKLAEMRRDYARQTSRAASGLIAELEQRVESERNSLTMLLSRLYKLIKY